MLHNPPKHFILVTGCNASGKTSFIYNNVDKLAGYEIIIPDIIYADFRKQQYPRFASAESVIEYKVKNALAAQKNLLFEAVFQSPELNETLDDISEIGYYMTMYHLLLPNHEISKQIVGLRNQKGGIFIHDEAVFENYYENLKNVAASIYLFNKAYFIDAMLPTKHPKRLVGTFINGQLKQYQHNNTFNGLLSYALKQFFIHPGTQKVVDAGLPFVDAAAFKGITSNTLDLNG